MSCLLWSIDGLFFYDAEFLGFFLFFYIRVGAYRILFSTVHNDEKLFDDPDNPVAVREYMIKTLTQ